MDQQLTDEKMEAMAAMIESLQGENNQLKNKNTQLSNYIEELEAFLKDEAAIYEHAAEKDPMTEIRTFSRGKETAFHYVLDILQKLKPTDTTVMIAGPQEIYYEKEVKLGHTISFFYSANAEIAASLKVIFKERATSSPEAVIEQIRTYLKQMPENLNCAINITFVP